LSFAGILGTMKTPDPCRLYVHVVWSTLASVKSIEPERRASIETHVIAGCRWLGAEPIEVCALPDRVHLLVRLAPVLSVQELVERLRDGVENHLAESGRVVRWAPGFAAVSVSVADVRRIRRRLASLGIADEPRSIRSPASRARSRFAHPRSRFAHPRG